MSNLNNESLMEQLYDEAWIDYAVTINTKRPAQYMPDTELAQFQ